MNFLVDKQQFNSSQIKSNIETLQEAFRAATETSSQIDSFLKVKLILINQQHIRKWIQPKINYNQQTNIQYVSSKIGKYFVIKTVFYCITVTHL